MDEMDNRLKKVETNLQRVEINQENMILPRLQNIEACYTSTYERYAKGTEQLENNAQDIELMRKVIIEHSEKLQRIS